MKTIIWELAVRVHDGRGTWRAVGFVYSRSVWEAVRISGEWSRMLGDAVTVKRV